MTILQAKNFEKRSDLEKRVAGLSGLTPEAKAHEIKGTKKELNRLGLSDRSIFWGISCTITDEPTVVERQKEKPVRGKIHEHNIN